MDWSSVAVSDFVASAAVALATTLVVEYLAKPWMDARKARMLRDRAQLDEIVFAFQKAVMIGSALLPETKLDHPAARAVQATMLLRTDEAMIELQNALSRLPHHFVAKHSEHIGKSARYIGFVVGVVSSSREAGDLNLAEVSDAIIDLSEFDAYFVANATLRDSQERWLRRWFSRHFMKDDYSRAASNALAKHGLLDEH